MVIGQSRVTGHGYTRGSVGSGSGATGRSGSGLVG